MNLLLFIIILSVLIFVHELGHFLAAKSAGILVEEFGFGLPPRLWGKKIGETIYSINALPIGGFVKLYGEDGGQEFKVQGSRFKVQGRAYFEKSIPRRLSVLLAGVVMNLLLAVVSFSVLYFVLGIPAKTGKIKIVGIAKDSPAQIAGLKENDVIVSLNSQRLSSTENFVRETKENAGKKVLLEIYREKDNPCEGSDKVLGGMAPTEPAVSCKGKNLLLYLIPRQSPPEGEGPLGVVVSEVELKKYPWWQMPYLGVREGLKESLSWGKMILSALKNTLISLIA
ncbi:MAG: M50 family metallopeptidase, partial [Microgenomates group bacterium]